VKVNTGASGWFNCLIVALSKTSQFVVHDDTQIAAAVACVFQAHVGEVQVTFNDDTRYFTHTPYTTNNACGMEPDVKVMRNQGAEPMRPGF